MAAALGMAVLAVLALILYLYLYRCQWRGKPGWRGLFLSKLLATPANRLDKPRVAERPVMSANLKCPQCGYSERVTERFLGRKVRCPVDGHVFRVDRLELKEVIESRSPES